MNTEYGLDEDELREAADLIRRSPPGIYTVRELYGQNWIATVSPTTFGGRFKASVASGRLPGIIFRDRTTSNHNQYEVLAR